MVHFVGSSLNAKSLSVTILDKEGDAVEDGVTLRVDAPTLFSSGKSLLNDKLTTSYWSTTSICDVWDSDDAITRGYEVLRLTSPLFEASVPKQKPASLLRQRIADGSSAWGTFSPNDNFYVDGYWDWLEDFIGRNKKNLKDWGLYDALYASLFSYDLSHNVFKTFCELWCPTTNTLWTENGDMSISLRDLWVIGGLPVDGSYYEEVIPSAKELLSVGKKDNNLPESCAYLFSAFRNQCQDVNGMVRLSASEWVHFWYRGSKVYPSPPKRDNRKRDKTPSRTFCPSGNIFDRPKRTKKERDPFVLLSVPERLIEEVNLAALISCWLCSFLLPTDKPSLIRPGVFKIASRIAHGECVNLAIPTLASIYQGLHKISSAKSLSKVDIIFPVQYVYGWLGIYFKTHFKHKDLSTSSPLMVRISGERMDATISHQESQELVRRPPVSTMWRNALVRDTTRELTDIRTLAPDWKAYMICLRSGFLTLRQGKSIIVEPYFPCRFGRQFGYYQDVVSDSSMTIRGGTLEEAASYWYNLTEHELRAKVTIPCKPDAKSMLVTVAYANWWSSYSSGLFSPKAKQPVRADAVPTKARRPKVNDDSSVLVVTNGKVSAHKPIMPPTIQATPPLNDRREESNGSSSIGPDASPQKSPTCLPGREKIEALKGLGVKPVTEGEKSLPRSTSKVDSATPRSRGKLSGANIPSKSTSRAKELDATGKDKLEEVFGGEESEDTQTAPLTKKRRVPPPVQAVDRAHSPTPSASVYFPGKMSNGLADQVRRHCLQQLKKYIPRTEDDIKNMRLEAESFYGTLSSLDNDPAELKGHVETYLQEVERCLKLEAQVDRQTPSVEILAKQEALSSELQVAQASVKEIDKRFSEETSAISHVHKRRKTIEAELAEVKAQEIELHGKLAETSASLEKAKEKVSAIEQELGALESPQATAEAKAEAEDARKRVQELREGLDA